VPIETTTAALASPAQQAAVRPHSVEVHPEFTLAFVEFDDQGRFWNREQLDLVLKTLASADDQPDNVGVAVVIFAHGWRHGCDVCDGNVSCFRTFLRQIHEDTKVATRISGGRVKPKRIIGIYVGWRGLSKDVQPFESLSFWARKRVAERIGEQDLVELLTRVENFVRRSNAADPLRSRLVLIGHSFGGTMVYHALANILKMRALQAAPLPSGAAGPENVIHGYGDLIVLMNPAFEASLYAPLHDIDAGFGRFSPAQSPVLVIVASETDGPNRMWFPLGRRIDTLFQKTGERSTREQIVTAVGNYEPFWTHRLTAIDPPAQTDGKQRFRAKAKDCSCALPLATIEDAEANYLNSLLTGSVQRAEMPAGAAADYGRARLQTLKPIDPHDPFWVVRASDDVVSGHNGIFTSYLTDFVRRIIIESSSRMRMAS
jgi:hypothetical protein